MRPNRQSLALAPLTRILTCRAVSRTDVGFAIVKLLVVVSVPVGNNRVLKITEVSPKLLSSGMSSVTSINRSPVPIDNAPDSANGVAES